MPDDALKLPKEPCPSCPYRKDVPSGVWTRRHYEMLLDYDKPTWAQPTRTFLCHQQNGCVCGGWLTTHDASELMAVRFETFAETMPLEAFEYHDMHDVPCFASGQEACDHGLRDIDDPGEEACALVEKMLRQKTRIKRGFGEPGE